MDCLPSWLFVEPRCSCVRRSFPRERLPCSRDLSHQSDRFPPDPKSIHEVETMIKKQLETEKDLNVHAGGPADLPPALRPPGFFEAARQDAARGLCSLRNDAPRTAPGPDISGRCLDGTSLPAKVRARTPSRSVCLKPSSTRLSSFSLFWRSAFLHHSSPLSFAVEDRDPTAVLIVGIMVSSRAPLRFVQEVRLGNAAERLQAMVRPPLWSCDGARAGNVPSRSLLWAT